MSDDTHASASAEGLSPAIALNRLVDYALRHVARSPVISEKSRDAVIEDGSLIRRALREQAQTIQRLTDYVHVLEEKLKLAHTVMLETQGPASR